VSKIDIDGSAFVYELTYIAMTSLDLHSRMTSVQMRAPLKLLDACAASNQAVFFF
jgi:hypothetical protein